MKKLLFLIVLMLNFAQLRAQEQVIKPGDLFEFNVTVPNDFLVEKLSQDKDYKIKAGHKIRVIDVNDNYITYRYLNFKDSLNVILFNDKSFNLPKSNFEDYTIQIYRIYKGANIGAYSVPFRLRGISNNFDFEPTLSLQANVVFGLGRKTSPNSWLDFSFGLGVTGVTINELNSNLTEGQRSGSAFTPSLGAVVKFSPQANIGLFVGKDFLSRKDKNVEWDYDKKTWLGIGVNVSFTEITGEKPPKRSEQ